MQRKLSVYKIINSQKGTSAVLFSAILTLLAVCAAITIDVGAGIVEKSKLSNAVDSAALAGAQELVSQRENTDNMVKSYLEKNSGEVERIDIKIADDDRTIEVSGVKSVDSYFSKIFGINKFDVSASATAKVENIKSLNGARPLAVIQQTFSYGKVYTLKEGGGDGTSGNYAAMALGGNGASKYGNNLLNGYEGTISVGDMIQTETGNIAGTTETSINHLVHECTHTPPCTYQSYNRNCARIIFIPVVDSLMINGKKYVKVLGFATFFLEGVTSHGGQADVIGRFITYNMEGETSSEINDYGLYGIKLIN
jgi:Flp pilus assembly protein TadG